MPDLTIPVPDDRVAEFLSHVGDWLQSPRGTEWKASEETKPTTSAWDASRSGEFDVAAAVWLRTTADEKRLIEQLCRTNRIALAEIAKVFGGTGAIGIVQLAVAINATCNVNNRQPCIVQTREVDDWMIKIEREAKAAFLGHEVPKGSE